MTSLEEVRELASEPHKFHGGPAVVGGQPVAVRPAGRGPGSLGALGGGERTGLQPDDAARARGTGLCVGAGLARLELQESLGVLTSRFGPPTIEAVGGGMFGIGAPDTLEVRFPLRSA